MVVSCVKFKTQAGYRLVTKANRKCFSFFTCFRNSFSTCQIPITTTTEEKFSADHWSLQFLPNKVPKHQQRNVRFGSAQNKSGSISHLLLRCRKKGTKKLDLMSFASLLSAPRPWQFLNSFWSIVLAKQIVNCRLLTNGASSRPFSDSSSTLVRFWTTLSSSSFSLLFVAILLAVS